MRASNTTDQGSGLGPVRTCVGCRVRTSATELLRVVAEGGRAGSAAVPDPRRRLPGRGAWLHPDAACLRQAERRRAFPRALRVTGPLDISALQEYLERPERLNRSGPLGSHQVARGQTDAGTSRARHRRKQVDPS
ncbi:YlxR family protein [Saccharopolyspora erythraea]|nr:YlxR family protein [Saccharopolyspora erythraea]